MAKNTEAEKELRQAIAIQEKMAAAFPGVPDYRHVLATSHYNIANLLAGMKRNAEAADEYCKGQEVLEKLIAEYPDAPEYRHQLAMNHSNFGVLLLRMGQR